MNIKKLFNTFTVLFMCFSLAGIVSCSALSDGESGSASGKADAAAGPTRLCITVGKLTSARSTITPTNLKRNEITRAALFYSYTDFVTEETVDKETGLIVTNKHETTVEKLVKEWEAADGKTALDVMENDNEVTLDGGQYDFILRLYSTLSGSEKLVAVSENKAYAVEPGANAINFTTSIPVEGQGDIEVTLNWDSDKRIGRVEAGLFTLDDDTVAVEGYDYSDCEVTGATEVKYAKTDVTAGHYYIKFNVYDSTDTTVISRFMDVIIVEPGRLSSDSRTLEDVDTLYTITYDTNGGEYVDGYTPVTVHNAYTGVLLPTDAKIKKTGYGFDGWLDICADECDGEKTRRTLLPTVTEESGTAVQNPLIIKDHTYQAQWSAEKYTLSYKDAEGKVFSGDEPLEAGAHTYGAPTTLPSPTKTGYIFGGWYTDENCTGTSYTEISAADITKDTTLYAKWTPVTYTVHFDLNSSAATNGTVTGAYSDVVLTYDEEYALEDATTTDGNEKVTTAFIYSGSEGSAAGKFGGWATKSDGHAAYANKGTLKNLSATDGAEVTLYATWIVGKYSVNFNANGGSGVTDGIEAEMNAGALLPENNFSKTGYTFTGWGTTTEGGTVYAAGATTDKALTDTIGDSVTLYAQWKANTYTVEFSNTGVRTNSRSATDDGKMEAVELNVTVAGTMSSMSLTYDADAVSLSEVTLIPPAGYKFVSWNTREDGKGAAYSDKAAVKNLTAEKDGTVTLYPVFSPCEYTVTYDGNKGVPATGTSTVYGRMGIQHTTYDSTDLVSINSYHRDGYIMDGWTTDSEGSNALLTVDTAYLNNLTATDGANVTLYAHWTPITYKVTYNSNGGDFSNGYDGTAETQTYDETYDAPSVVARPGYTFKGWSATSSAVTAKDLCKATSDAESATESTVKNACLNNGEDLTLYAVWELNKYKITYTTNSGSWKNTSYVQTYDYINGATLPTSRDIYRSGYAFQGWKNPDGSYETVIAPGNTGDKSYTANWRANCVTLSLSDSFMLFTSTGTTKQCSANPTFTGGGRPDPYPVTIWSSADESIATVDANGLVKAMGTGTTTVTAKVDDKIATCVVVVKSSNSALEYNTGTNPVSLGYQTYYTNNQYLLAFYSTNWGNIDFVGRPNTWTDWQQTTYARYGWSYQVESSNSAATYSVTAKPVIAYDGNTGINYVVMYLILTNTSETESATYKFGYHSDVQMGANDYAPVQETNYGFRMWDDNAHIELQAHTRPVKYSEVTNVDHQWMGVYYYRRKNNFVTYDGYPNPLTGVDSSIAFSWNNIPLGPGESAIRCVYFTLKGI